MSTAQRKLQVWPIVAGILVVGILLLAASDFLGAWVRDRLRAEERVKVVEAVSPALEDYQREQADLLGNYDWVDQENGVVQLPIERAMELVAEEEGGEQ
jgi:type II secretory pathway pseudopilin PulG